MNEIQIILITDLYHKKVFPIRPRPGHAPLCSRSTSGWLRGNQTGCPS